MLVSDQLFTPCFLTLPGDTPRFMLHVYIDDITTSATLSDTAIPIGTFSRFSWIAILHLGRLLDLDNIASVLVGTALLLLKHVKLISHMTIPSRFG
jgi:hypothetical protein